MGVEETWEVGYCEWLSGGFTQVLLECRLNFCSLWTSSVWEGGK